VKKDRKTLEKELLVIFEKYNANKNVISKVTEGFVERGFYSGDVLRIVDGHIPVETIDNPTLYLLTKLFHDNTDERTINPTTWYNETEITDGNSYRREKIKMGGFPVVIEGVFKVKDDIYDAPAIPCQIVNNWWARNLVTYNRETQRQTKQTKFRDQLVEIIDINNESVQSIKENILNGTQETNHITLNLLQDGTDEFVYDAKNHTLTINSGELDILDGMHRSMGMLSAINDNSDVEYITGVYIRNYDTDKAIQYIKQENEHNEISKVYIQSKDTTQLETIIVKKVNESPSSDLRGKIGVHNTDIINGDSLTTFETLINSLKYEYELNEKTNSKRDAIVLSEWIVEFLNEVAHIFTDFKTTKNESFMNHKYSFIGYITLSKELKDNTDWRTRLNEILSKIDFSLENSIWIDSFKFDTHKLSKTNYKKIANYFRKFV